MVIAIKFMRDRKHNLLVILIFTCLALSFSFFSDWKGPLSILLVVLSPESGHSMFDKP